MKLGLILSNDWELFGDGSGDYFEIQHKPLESVLEVVEKYGAKLTVMAEVGQQWAHQRIIAREPWAQNIVAAWESVLKEAIKRKHDVQFHLHPQWLDAEYGNKGWQVKLENWAISSLSPERMANTFKQGKLYLEDVLKSVLPSYECIAFRAGAYCLQPSTIVIQNLINAGIVCDTSVTKGMYNQGFVDYRDAYSSCLPWFVSNDDIRYQSDRSAGLLEIPIHSYSTIDIPLLREFLSPRLYYLILGGTWLARRDVNWLLERRKKEFQRYSILDRPFVRTTKINSARWLLSKVVATVARQLDYDILPPKVFAKRMQKILEDKVLREYEDREIIVPVMASGHVKRIHNCNNVDQILNEVQTRLKERVTFWTLSEAVNCWMRQPT